jgi:purine-binding chemotaxis protein CheW
MKSSGQAETMQFLTFKLGGEVFAFAIGRVREVLDYTAVTKIPEMPAFMLGVINLRGSVVTVVDMRLKFGMGPTSRGLNTCIVIVEIEIEGETTVLGALADSVQEVVDLDPEHIEGPPRIGGRIKSSFIEGMCKDGEDLITVLDIDRVFSPEELEMGQNCAQEPVAAS